MTMQELLTTEDQWTQGAYARDAEGRACAVGYTFVCRWCLVGAIHRCYPQDLGLAVIAAITDAMGLYNLMDNLVEWNDEPERTFAEVRELIERLDV